MAAPIVLAKGGDEIAQKIKAIAAELHIPMVENVHLARALAREVQIGAPIAANWFKPVAEIVAAVYRLLRGRRRRPLFRRGSYGLDRLRWRVSAVVWPTGSTADGPNPAGERTFHLRMP